MDLLLYIPTIIFLAIIYQWDSPLAIRIGTGEGAKQWDINTGLIKLTIVGCFIAAAVDVLVKLKKFKAIGD